MMKHIEHDNACQRTVTKGQLLSVKNNIDTANLLDFRRDAAPDVFFDKTAA